MIWGITIFVAVLSRFSSVSPCVTLWTVAHQTSLSMAFSRKEYWSGLLFPSPGDLPDQGIEPTPLMSHALADKFFIMSTAWEARSPSLFTFSKCNYRCHFCSHTITFIVSFSLLMEKLCIFLCS